MNNPHLFIFTIGPVKSFIAEARKTHDLFAGSGLLSHLCKKAMEKAVFIFDRGEEIIITPEINSDNKPNRFVAIIDAKGFDLKASAVKIENSVMEEFLNIPSLLFPSSIKKPTGFDDQLSQHLNLEWVYVPIDNNDNHGYKKAYQQLFRELSAVKKHRSFSQLGYQNNLGEIGRKCSVDGSLNVKYYRPGKNDKIDKLNLKLFIPEDEICLIQNEENVKVWHLQEGEGLSAVSMVKRLFLNEPHQFPSTARVALMNLFEVSKNLKSFQKYREKVEGRISGARGDKFFPHSDDQLFYQENIKQIFEGHARTTDEIERAEDMHKAWVSELSENKISEPFTKYYSLIRFDGDNIGDWLLGDNLKSEVDLEDFHRNFTCGIANFAREIDKYLVAPKGKTVYAGGEDFMALINLHHLFDVLDYINQTYRRMIDEQLSGYKSNQSLKFTISAGVAIAHYKQPLMMVLQRAEEMEKLAKNSGKNSFAIGLMKHSGGTMDFVLPWKLKIPINTKNSDDSLTAVESVKLLKFILDASEENFSNAYIHNIYDALEEVGFEMPHDMLTSLITLYTSQANNKKGMKTIRLVSVLMQLLNTFVKSSQAHQIEPFRNFTSALLVCDFLNRKTK